VTGWAFLTGKGRQPTVPGVRRRCGEHQTEGRVKKGKGGRDEKEQTRVEGGAIMVDPRKTPDKKKGQTKRDLSRSSTFHSAAEKGRER